MHKGSCLYKTMRLFLYVVFILISLSSCSHKPSSANNSNQYDRQLADQIARETALWFQYTTGPVKNEQMGQCGDYALRFILKYNETVGKNIARLVVANNPIPSGTYRVGEKTDVAKLGFKGFSTGVSGFLMWDGKLYLYHPKIGAYEIFIEKEWTPKLHFGVNMLNKAQVHVWASVGDLSVDPTYFDLWPDKFSNPLGRDE